MRTQNTIQTFKLTKRLKRSLPRMAREAGFRSVSEYIRWLIESHDLETTTRKAGNGRTR